LHIGPNYAAQAEEYADLLALAALPNVYVKFSGLQSFAKEPPWYPDMLPLTRGPRSDSASWRFRFPSGG
jgi:predicted TIM-barrel fold metal-dependent hydrolase